LLKVTFHRLVLPSKPIVFFGGEQKIYGIVIEQLAEVQADRLDY
jgi:hypothetical protein